LCTSAGRSPTRKGAGAQIPIPRGRRLKPVEALESWLAGSKISEGPVFVSIGKGGRVERHRLSSDAIAEIVKRYAAAAGSDPSNSPGTRCAPVSSPLREDGADMFKVMDVTLHRRVETLKGYDRRAKAFRNHDGDGFL
jgi:hypothetical protein